MLSEFKLEKLNPGSAAHRKAFIAFYYELLRAQEKWIAPLRILQEQVLNPNKNPFLQNVPHHFYMITTGGQTVGRFAIFGPGISEDQPSTGSFGFIDFKEDCAPVVFQFLKGEALKLGMKNLVGPLNPNIHYDVGVMAKGFDQQNYVMMNHNPSYYPACFEKAGFEVLQRFNTWSLWRNEFQTDTRLQNALHRAQQNKDVVLRKADLKNFSHELKIFHRLYNESFKTHWGFQPISFEEFQFIASDLKYLMQAEMALVAEVKGEAVGFVLSIPNMNELLENNREGKLTASLVFNLLFRRKSINTVRVMITGVLPAYRKRGVHLMLFHQIATNIFDLGYKGGEIAWVMEGNRSVEHTLSRMGAQKEKQYLLYQISLKK